MRKRPSDAEPEIRVTTGKSSRRSRWLLAAPPALLALVLLHAGTAYAGDCKNPSNEWVTCTFTGEETVEELISEGEPTCDAWGPWGPWGAKCGIVDLSVRVRRRLCHRNDVYQVKHICKYKCRHRTLGKVSTLDEPHNHDKVSKKVTYAEYDKDWAWFDPPKRLWDQAIVENNCREPIPYRSQFTIFGKWIDALEGVTGHNFTLDGQPIVEEAPFDFTPFGPGRHSLKLSVNYADRTVKSWEIRFTTVEQKPEVQRQPRKIKP